MAEQDLQNQINNLYEILRRHTHSGGETSNLSKFNTTYHAQEIDLGNVSGTATIDWSRSNMQYVTMTADTTFTFMGAPAGMRAILQVAGAFTPTWPSNVRWSGGSAPGATAASGKKDIYSFIYSGKESLYDGVQSSNFATS